MHFYIPLWLCWTGGVIVALTVGLAVGATFVVGLGAENRDLNALFCEPYPDPHEAPAARPRQHHV